MVRILSSAAKVLAKARTLLEGSGSHPLAEVHWPRAGRKPETSQPDGLLSWEVAWCKDSMCVCWGAGCSSEPPLQFPLRFRTA